MAYSNIIISDQITTFDNLNTKTNDSLLVVSEVAVQESEELYNVSFKYELFNGYDISVSPMNFQFVGLVTNFEVGGKINVVEKCYQYISNYLTSINVTHSLNTDSVVLHVDASNKNSYPGTGTVLYDLSTKDNNGILYNGVMYNSTSGGLLFDGVTDYVKIDNIIVTSPSELTIGGWIMKHEVGGSSYECALHHGNGTSIGASSYWFGFQTDTNIICVTIGGSSVGWGAGTTGIVAQFDTWYHVCASWNGSIVRVFVNGIYNKQYNLTSYSNQITATRIGASGDGTGYVMSGEVGEIFIQENFLTDGEVLGIYNSTISKFK
jgi:hypothetical protein